MKFENKSFTPTQGSDIVEEKPFERNMSDNPVFKDWQVDNLPDIITDDCIAYYDADTLFFQAASNQETKFIKVTHTEEGWSEELAGIKVFKGLGKGIKKDSWLWLKNLERETEGKEPYKLEDFSVEDCSKLNGEKDYCLEQAKIQVNMKLKRVRQQFGLAKIICVIGSGVNFRHSLPLCRLYKGNRKETAPPILLKELRQWAVDKGLAMLTPESPVHGNIETDDYVDMMGWQGALHYNKTGKFNKICILSDKDGNNSAKIVCNPDTYSGDHPKKGKFKFPQPFRVPNTQESAGDIEIIPKEKSADYKFIGFKGLLWQILTSDGADNYSALGHLNGGMGFGTESAYKILKPCKTAKEALQATIDTFAELLPYGVQYKDHKGDEQDVTTLEYINYYFRTAYMLRSLDDNMDFFKLCKAFKVDTSKIENNNLLTAPYEVVNEEALLKIVESYDKVIDDLQGQELKSYKSDKKDGLVSRLDITGESLNEAREFSKNNLYKLVQRNKQTGEIREVTDVRTN